MTLETLLEDVRACRACAGELPHEPRPVVRVGAETRLLICGQAPGRRVHESGLPWDDPSGDRLREWMGLDRTAFYGDPRIGVAAMAFCFPGASPKGGDYPPPKRCAQLWRPGLLQALPKAQLTLLVGSYALAWTLKSKAPMTDLVRGWRDLPADVVPLPHPSWRTTMWLRRNPWFAEELLPELRAKVAGVLG